MENIASVAKFLSPSTLNTETIFNFLHHREQQDFYVDPLMWHIQDQVSSRSKQKKSLKIYQSKGTMQWNSRKTQASGKERKRELPV